MAYFAMTGTDPLGLILVAFDGTWQHEQQDQPTNASRFVDAYREGGNGPVIYRRGIGNELDNGRVGQAAGGVFGTGGHEQVEEAYNVLTTQYNEGLRTGDATRTNIDILGYSRGGAQAIALANRIEERGIPLDADNLDRAQNLGTHTEVTRERLLHGRQPRWRTTTTEIPVDRPQPRFLGTFDPVPSFGPGVVNVSGVPVQGPNLGWDLSDPGDVANTANVIRRPDGRFGFRSLDWAADARLEVDMNHGQAGTSDRTLEWMYQQAEQAGINCP